MRRLAARAALAAAALALPGSTVAGYLIRRNDAGAEVTWNLASSAPNVVAGRITFYVDPGGVPDVTPQQFADAVRSAIRSWEDVPRSGIAFEEDPARDANQRNSSDRINRIGYTAGVNGPFTFASTFVQTSKGRITDADVVFNPSLDWAVVSPGNPARADVEGVAAHEWGHAIGIDHVPAARSTMYFASSLGGVSLRSLETDDAAAAVHAYPDPSGDGYLAAVRGSVDVLGTADERGIQVTAVDFVTGRPAASHFSEPDGSYEIRGLAPGSYYLVASPIGTQKAAFGVYSRFWESSATGIVPAVRGQDGASDGTAGSVLLDAGEVVLNADLAVAATADPLEPDGTMGTATPLSPGRSAAARIEDLNDRDFYSFTGAMGQRVTVLLHARRIGSDLDPRLFLRTSAGLLLATSQDISTGYTTPEGADLDCRILDFPLPAAGTYYLEVEPEESPDAGRPEDYFYVLTLLAAGGPASPYTSGFSISPAVAPADGVSTVTLEFSPLTAQGTAIAEGASVSFDLLPDGDADGAVGPAIPDGGGTWTAQVTAPSEGGADVVRALVDGTPVRTAVVAWRGVADFAASDFTASPRRLRFDGAAQAAVRLVPRDANGVPFGAGRPVSFSLEGAPDASVGPATDVGDGSYTAKVTAGNVPESLGVAAQVDGSDLGGTLFVGVGFPLEPVVDDVLADVEALVADAPATPRSPAARLGKARDLLLPASLLDGDADALLVLVAVKGAVLQLERAAGRGAATEDLCIELAESAREKAEAALLDALPRVDTPLEAKRLLEGEALRNQGEILLGEGRWSRAAAKFRAAFLRASKVE